MPSPATALVYPGQVIWEGTNVSESRGTTQPFEQFGAPYLDPDTILASIGGGDQPGAVLRPVTFEITSIQSTSGVVAIEFQSPFMGHKHALEMRAALNADGPWTDLQPPQEAESALLPAPSQALYSEPVTLSWASGLEPAIT